MESSVTIQIDESDVQKQITKKISHSLAGGEKAKRKNRNGK